MVQIYLAVLIQPCSCWQVKCIGINLVYIFRLFYILFNMSIHCRDHAWWWSAPRMVTSSVYSLLTVKIYFITGRSCIIEALSSCNSFFWIKTKWDRWSHLKSSWLYGFHPLLLWIASDHWIWCPSSGFVSGPTYTGDSLSFLFSLIPSIGIHEVVTFKF